MSGLVDTNTSWRERHNQQKRLTSLSWIGKITNRWGFDFNRGSSSRRPCSSLILCSVFSRTGATSSAEAWDELSLKKDSSAPSATDFVGDTKAAEGATGSSDLIMLLSSVERLENFCSKVVGTMGMMIERWVESIDLDCEDNQKSRVLCMWCAWRNNGKRPAGEGAGKHCVHSSSSGT